MGTRRLFLGLELPAAWSRALNAHARETLGPLAGARVYAPRDLHLTLVFLGAFAEDRREELAATLAQRVSAAPAPLLLLGGTGAFPHRRQPRILWAGVSESTPLLEGLRERVWSAATASGWCPQGAERERPFRPHVTLARTGRGAPGAELERFFVDAAEGFAGEAVGLEPWAVGEVAVFESQPDGREGRYPVLSRARL